MIKVHDSLTPTNRYLLETMKRPARLMKVLGVELRNVYNQHLASLGRPYSNLVRPYLASNPEYDDYHASVHIVGQGGAIFAHKITGGWIYPKNSKMLAIPLTSKAKKWGSPRENRHPGLKIVRLGRNWFLQERDYVKKVRGKWKQMESELQYILKDKVYHRPDTRATVPESKVFVAINARIKDWFYQFKGGKNLSGNK